MRIFLKVAAVLIVLIIAAMSSIVLWFDRNQNIDFAASFPDKFETCNGTVSKGSKEYQALLDWFQVNETGWKNYLVTMPSGHLYRSPELTINVSPNSVIVRYSDNDEVISVIHTSKPKLNSKGCDGDS